MFTTLLWFAGVAALINVTPGLDTMLVLRTSVAHGRTGGRAAALGILAGCLAWGAATAVGLTALLTASRVAFDALRIGGAGYLVWLGCSALWQARRRPAGTDGRRHRRRRPHRRRPRPGRRGGPPSGPASAPICSTPRRASST